MATLAGAKGNDNAELGRKRSGLTLNLLSGLTLNLLSGLTLNLLDGGVRPRIQLPKAESVSG